MKRIALGLAALLSLLYRIIPVRHSPADRDGLCRSGIPDRRAR